PKWSDRKHKSRLRVQLRKTHRDNSCVRLHNGKTTAIPSENSLPRSGCACPYPHDHHTGEATSPFPRLPPPTSRPSFEVNKGGYLPLSLVRGPPGSHWQCI